MCYPIYLKKLSNLMKNTLEKHKVKEILIETWFMIVYSKDIPK